MGVTVSNYTGDGVTTLGVSTNIELPDSGGQIIIGGAVDPIGANPAVPITGSPLTAPSPPGSGSIFWNIQVDTGTGVATLAQSTSADPVPAGNNVVVFRQTLVPTSGSNLATDASSTPDSW